MSEEYEGKKTRLLRTCILLKLIATHFQVAEHCRTRAPLPTQWTTSDHAVQHLLNAAQHANESAKLWLISLVALLIGYIMLELRAKLDIKNSMMPTSNSFQPLCHAANARAEEIYAQERKKQETEP
ncbi:hypothetical protein BC628DRAFT_915481 [Trametes gibbosa]|nr:hypothetical protein BC628DRAFT_915481 [Trametes gibbosa]